MSSIYVLAYTGAIIFINTENLSILTGNLDLSPPVYSQTIPINLTVDCLKRFCIELWKNTTIEMKYRVRPCQNLPLPCKRGDWKAKPIRYKIVIPDQIVWAISCGANKWSLQCSAAYRQQWLGWSWWSGWLRSRKVVIDPVMCPHGVQYVTAHRPRCLSYFNPPSLGFPSRINLLHIHN